MGDHLFHIVCCHDECMAFEMQMDHMPQDLLNSRVIEVGKGFIEEDRLRFHCEDSCNGKALFFSS